ncbi:MAG: GNAT family N-acetyltransferase, partial [Anaeroplasmataceae bacterium]|nr:GNAT family N-acetyltransferase [Anaeroplasmataceae bacterium]
MVRLKELEFEDEVKFVSFCKRYQEECGAEVIPYSMNPKNLPFKEFYQDINRCKSIETLPEGFVLAKYYLIWDENNEIVGGINIRYQDNDFILNHAGHIGYGIAPWERKKGYAKEALKQILLIARELGLEKVLLTTDENNIASQHVILSTGGVLEKTMNGKKFYWINIGPWKKEESAMAIVIVKNKILATKELVYGKVRLSVPKGHVENNETYIETAMRECFEETGIQLQKDNYKKSDEPEKKKRVKEYKSSKS